MWIHNMLFSLLIYKMFSPTTQRSIKHIIKMTRPPICRPNCLRIDDIIKLLHRWHGEVIRILNMCHWWIILTYARKERRKVWISQGVFQDCDQVEEVYNRDYVSSDGSQQNWTSSAWPYELCHFLFYNYKRRWREIAKYWSYNIVN